MIINFSERIYFTISSKYDQWLVFLINVILLRFKGTQREIWGDEKGLIFWPFLSTQ